MLPPNASPASLRVVVVSCDKYADLWPVFFDLWGRFWPDCPYPVSLVSNRQTADLSGVHNLLVGDDRSWSANLREALTRVPEEYVLMTLDDLFLVAPVNTDQVRRTVNAFLAIRGNCLKLNPTVPGDIPRPGPFNESAPGTLYRASTVATVWSRAVLLALLDDRENAWEFEMNGTTRTRSLAGFYSAKKAHIPLLNGVIRGRWSRRARRRIAELATLPLSGERAELSLLQEIRYQWALFRSTWFLRLFRGRGASLRRLWLERKTAPSSTPAPGK